MNPIAVYMKYLPLISEIDKFYENKNQEYNQHHGCDDVKKSFRFLFLILHISDELTVILSLKKSISQQTNTIFPRVFKRESFPLFIFFIAKKILMRKYKSDPFNILLRIVAEEGVVRKHFHGFGSRCNHWFTCCQVFINFPRVVPDGKLIDHLRIDAYVEM